MRHALCSILLVLALPPSVSGAAPPPAAAAPAQAPAAPPSWISRSDAIAQQLLRNEARVSPEGAARVGLAGFDEQILDLSRGWRARERAMVRANLALLEAALRAESHPLVQQDIEIMLARQRDALEGIALDERYNVPFFSVSEAVFGGLRALLDDQLPPERRKAALARLRKYAGMEKGFAPLAQLARERTQEELGKPGLLMPSRAEVERQLQMSPVFIEGIGKLFQQYQLAGYEQPFAKLRQQLEAYDGWVKAELLPKARADFRLPPPLYALALRQLGVNAAPEQLAAQAHQAFDGLRAEMQQLSARIAQARHLPSADYRDVLKALRHEQVAGEAILPLYQQRLGEIEAIIQRERLVSLPQRPARIRLASAAESASNPAPHMRPPPFVNNHGEQGEFVLPLNNPSAGDDGRMDDFTNTSAAWTLTAHEARPGHELQFASAVERGVSLARALYALNSANVEGWGLYSEWLLYPYMPDDAKLLSLWSRAFRAARAFLDPELQAGKLTPEQALAFLEKEVVMSHGLAVQEVDRYTFRSPGQATSYFYGYSKLRELRRDVEQALGPRFEAQRFHDAVLEQGMLPPELLRKAIFDGYVAPALASPGPASSSPGAARAP